MLTDKISKVLNSESEETKCETLKPEMEPTAKKPLSAQEMQIIKSELEQMLSQGNIYFNSEKFEKARPIYKEVMEKRQEMLGPDHPDTLMVKYNYATTLSVLMKYREAEIMFEELISGMNQVLGPHNPATLDAKFNCANTLRKMKKLKKAKGLYYEVVKG